MKIFLLHGYSNNEYFITSVFHKTNEHRVSHNILSKYHIQGNFKAIDMLTATSASPATESKRILSMTQHAYWLITFGMNDNN